MTPDDKPLRKHARKHVQPEPDVSAFAAFAAPVAGEGPGRSSPDTRDGRERSLRIPEAAVALGPDTLGEVARALAVSESCAAALKHAAGANAHLLRNILDAEMARATTLLHLRRFLQSDVTPERAAVSVSALVRHAIESVESERTLRGVQMSMSVPSVDMNIDGDEALLTHVLRSLILTTFTILNDVDAPRVTVIAERTSDRRCLLTIEQTHVPPPRGWLPDSDDGTRLADHDTVMRAVALCAAQRLAMTGNGRCDARARERATAISIDVPLAQRTD